MEKYNGWTNYATWRINLEIIDGLDPSDLLEYHGEDAYELGLSLKDYVEEMLEYQSNGLALSYARAFISDVDWYEIATHIIEAHKETA
jgi:hypothetical protein